MLIDWGQACGAFAVDLDAVRRAIRWHGASRVRTPADRDWLPLDERERRSPRASDGQRPPSYFSYPLLG